MAGVETYTLDFFNNKRNSHTHLQVYKLAYSFIIYLFAYYLKKFQAYFAQPSFHKKIPTYLHRYFKLGILSLQIFSLVEIVQCELATQPILAVHTMVVVNNNVNALLHTRSLNSAAIAAAVPFK